MADVATVRDSIELHLLEPAVGISEGLVKAVSLGDNRQLFHAGTRRDANGELITAGGRVLAVVAQGDDFDQAFAAAYSGLQQVKFEGITYRRDIGHQVRSSG